MLWEYFLPLVSFLGLIAGIVLAKVSPEEMKPGKRIFMLLRLAILTSIIILLLIYSRSNILYVIAGFVIGFFFRVTYLYLGLALASSFFAEKTHMVLFASLIFLYGLPYGTLLQSHRMVKVEGIVLLALMFLVPMFILLIPSGLSFKPLFSLSAGLLIGSLRHFRNLY